MKDEFIRKAMIYFYGDPSVGIQSYSFDVEIPAVSIKGSHREYTRELLRECYEDIDGEFTPVIIFDDEQLD